MPIYQPLPPRSTSSNYLLGMYILSFKETATDSYYTQTNITKYKRNELTSIFGFGKAYFSLSLRIFLTVK